MIDSKCKQCRAVGEKLFLKGERCFTPKCAFIRRPYRPGVHGQRRRRALSEFALGLLEKQKVKRTYGVRERQFKKYFETASLKKPSKVSALKPADLLLAGLEKRLDNVVYRLGLAFSRSVARQLVSHGHFLVNGRRVSVPSHEVRVGDAITIRPQSAKMKIFGDLKESLKKYKTPAWLITDAKNFEGKIKAEPTPEEIGSPFNISLIIDHYSR